ncbi:MAG: sulfatase-like hydrolase/transferase, partial [Bacteroidales bacterium]|nr:sulfatase-like hydrolase/transferase [Bacteroidales bacterium]
MQRSSTNNRHHYKTLLAAGTGLSLMNPVVSQTDVVKSTNPSQENKHPNILFILADDLGYGDLGCYGNTVVKTPVIDSLAAAGLRFTDFYAGASVSSPSRGCLLTGLHTGHARIRGNMCRVGGMEGEREGIPGKVRRTNLQPEDKTLGDLLRDQGYRTCLVNKWHVDGFDTTATPLDRGFDEFYGWLVHEPRSHNFYPDVRWRNRERYEIPANQNGLHTDHNTDRATDEAVAFITRMGKGVTPDGCQLAAGQATGQPFFLYMAYNAPHVPLDAKDTLLYAGQGLPDTDRRYAAMISHMDASIGRLMNTLREQGLADNTLVVFAS